MSKHKYLLKRDVRDERDYLFYDNFIMGTELPASVDLRSKMPPIFNQLELGSCSSNATCACLMYTIGANTPMLSRLFHYWEERNIENTVSEDSGAMLIDACKVVQTIGICTDELFPYDITQFTDTPTPVMDSNAKNYIVKGYHRVKGILQVQQALALGMPVIIGMDVFASMESDSVAKTGILPMPKHGEQLLGGHATLVVAYETSSHINPLETLVDEILNKSTSNISLTVRNSWGSTWGQAGHFIMSEDYFEKYVTDAWVLEK